VTVIDPVNTTVTYDCCLLIIIIIIITTAFV